MTRRVVVTGGTRGIGAAIAARFTAAGDDVIAVGRARCDVTDEAAVAALFESLGPVDVLVNNAGVASSAPLKRTTLADWRGQLDVNATGAFLCTRAALPGMAERGSGRIVTVASTAGLVGAKYTAAYTASKHAAVGLTRAVAAEIAGTGVTANAVCPAFVRTDLTRESVRRIAETHGPQRGRGRGRARRRLAARAAARARRGRLRSGLPRRARGRRDQRTDAHPRRRRDPGMTPFRASPGFTESWQHFDFAVDDGVATLTLQPPRQAQRADLRRLRRPARPARRAAPPRRRARARPHRRGTRLLLGRRRRGDHRRAAAHADRRAARVHADDRRGRQGPARVPAARHRGDQRRRRRRRLGDRAGQRLPPAGAVGVVRLPLHAGRPVRRRHGVGLPAAADRRAGPRDGAAGARRQGAGRAGRAHRPGDAGRRRRRAAGGERGRSRAAWPTVRRWPTRRRRSCSRASST